MLPISFIKNWNVVRNNLFILKDCKYFNINNKLKSRFKYGLF